MTDISHWHRVQEVFNSVVERPPGERAALLAEACGDDAELRAEVESLLACNAQTPVDFMRPPEPPPGIRPPDVPEGPDPLIGQRIGSYRINGVIAAGGMGTVYEAEQEQPRRVVALKVMNRYVASRSALRRFQSESQILAYLRHPNIAQVYEAGMHGGREGIHGPADVDPSPDRKGAVMAPGVPYFAMEYIPDAKTITRFAEENQLDTRDRLRLFAKVCDAVHHGHQKGIIHRDLKPGNILVDSAGEPKVIDFGVARATDSDIAVTTLRTDVGQLIGTLQYMSPEQCDADPHEIDTRSDVYSLGVVLYELLTGALPYEATGSTIVQAAQIIKEHAPERLSAINPRLRGDVETIVLKALEKDREKRYDSAADLAQDLRRFLNREPIEACRPTAWMRSARWVARHPLVSAAVVTVLGTAAITLVAILIAAWHVNARPHRMWVSPDGREARLLSFIGGVLQAWDSDRPGGLRLAQLVDRPVEFGGGKLAVVAFTEHPGDRSSALLRAFDVGDSLEKPVWEGRLDPDAPLPDPHNRGYTPEQFYIRVALVADIFPGNPGDEVVTVYNHQTFSQCIIRIYDLRGEVVYQIWHDAVLPNCYWMADVRQLVFAGLNGQATWEERGYSGIHHPHPCVVFAIRPALRFIATDFLKTDPGNGPLSAAWYKCVFPPEATGGRALDFICSLGPPYLTLPDRSVKFYLRLREDTDIGVGWSIDEFGNEVPNTRIPSDNYNRNQLLADDDPNKLPDPSTFKLRLLPPIVSTPVEAPASSDADGDNP